MVCLDVQKKKSDELIWEKKRGKFCNPGQRDRDESSQANATASQRKKARKRRIEMALWAHSSCDRTTWKLVPAARRNGHCENWSLCKCHSICRRLNNYAPVQLPSPSIQILAKMWFKLSLGWYNFLRLSRKLLIVRQGWPIHRNCEVRCWSCRNIEKGIFYDFIFLLLYLSQL